MGNILSALDATIAQAWTEARRIDTMSGYAADPFGASDAAIAAHDAAWAVFETLETARRSLGGQVFAALNTAMAVGALRPE